MEYLDETMQVRFAMGTFGRDYKIAIFGDDANRLTNRIVEPLIIKQIEPTDNYIGDIGLFAMNKLQCQQLMDDMWAAGIRPVEAEVGSEVLTGLRNHLADTKKLHTEDRQLLESFIIRYALQANDRKAE